ncbi:NYN domain-containing protein [Parasphingorhabdus sp.]|uniref:NYN domain-containing protein n=1 Tax=Parasphingorhabdus sp. TaxID=2709688 RepID=UPI00300131E0
MEPDQTMSNSLDRRIALLIDAENVSHTKVVAMLAELSKYGTANIRRAYGDWASSGLKGWKTKLHEFAIRPIQQFSYSTGKNATDIALVIDAMELLYTQKLDAFCIASSDADFTPLIMQLKANGHEVYGFGERKTPEPFINACTTFLFLDSLDDAVSCDAGDKSSAKVANASKVKGKRIPKKPAKAGAIPPEALAAPLSQDTTLVTILRGAVEASAHDDGWAAMSAAGSAVKRQAPIDPRNYGVKNFPGLFEATGLFEIFKAESGQSYVADKRNTDRLPRPDR